MKKLLLSTVLLSLITFANAQITLDSTDYATVGDTIFMANDTIPIDSGISVGGTGFQIWDFTNLSLDEIDTIIFIHPDSTLFGGNFPSSNLATEDTIITNYQTSSATQLTNDGFAGDPFGFGITASAVFDPPQKILDFPSTFNGSFTDTIKYTAVIPLINPPVPGLDSIKDIHESYISSDISAFGTVMLPGDTFNTIRQFYTESTIDSVYIYCSDTANCLFFPFGWSFIPGGLVPQLPENPITDTIYTYSWWAKGEGFPVVEIETDSPAGNVLSGRFKIESSGVLMASIISVTNATCADVCDGEATVIGIGGVSPYSYLWNDSLTQDSSTLLG